MDQTSDRASSSSVPANYTSSPPPSSTCGSSSSVGVGLSVGGGESMLVPVVLDELTFDNRQVPAILIPVFAVLKPRPIAGY